MIVGLTGGIGSGKTTVSDMFSSLGIDIVDADIVAREVVQPGAKALKAIAEKFGKSVLLKNGQLNRAELRTRVFSCAENKEWLNALLHPLIRYELIRQLEASTSPYCILVAPLLLENKLEQFVHRVLVIDVDEKQQIDRTLKRDSSDLNEVKSIIKSQISRHHRLEAADDVIHNTSTNLEELQQQVLVLHNKYLEMAKA